MRRNGPGQEVSGHLVSKTDGSDVTTGTTTVYVRGAGGSQAEGSGSVVHDGQGSWRYNPAQAETDFDHVVFTFVHADAVSADVQVYPSTPQTGDAFARLGAPTGASIAADIQTRSSHSAADVWAAADRTLTGFGTLVADVASAVWAAATRTLTTLVGLTGYTAPDNVGIAAAQAASEANQGTLAAMTEDDAGTPRFTANALEQAPAGGGGGGDATEATLLLVKAKTDALPGDPASEATVAERLAASAYTVPDNAGIATANANLGLIKASTDALPATPAAQEKLDTLEGRLTAARAINLDNLDVLLSTRSTFDPATDKVTPIDVDGVTHEQAMAFLMAIVGNVTVPSGSSVAFKRRDGTTTLVTISYGVTDGERVASELAV